MTTDERLHWLNKIEAMEKERDEARMLAGQYAQALELIAAPVRADGTYNRSREACEELARLALGRTRVSRQHPLAEALIRPAVEVLQTQMRKDGLLSSDEAMKIDSYTYQNDHGQHPDGHCSKCRSWRVCKCDNDDSAGPPGPDRRWKLACEQVTGQEFNTPRELIDYLAARLSSDSCSGCLDGKHSWVTCFGNTYCCDCDAKPDSKSNGVNDV